MRTTCLLALVPFAAGHGHITYPPSTRHGGSLAEAGRCAHGECMYFSQPVSIPGQPTVNDSRLRTYNVGVSGGKDDWSRHCPWRAPGTAPVFGSGCGLAGGNKVPLPNGGTAVGVSPGQRQGDDGLWLPRREPVEWVAGSVQEVAFGLTANHGGGYSWRLCKLGGAVSEECFQSTVLRFAGDTQWIQYGNQTYQYDKMVQLPRFELPLVKTSTGTYPPGSEWARVQVPGCKLCDQSVCGEPLLPNMTEKFKPGSPYPPDEELFGGLAWFRQQQCAQSCSGLNLTACPPGLTQFPEVLPGISGYTGAYPPVGQPGLPFSIVDKVLIPQNLESGDYLLSWRWDCEQSHQVWQNCADVRIIDARVV